MAVMGPTASRQTQRWAGNLLRTARAMLEISQRELAEAARVPQSTVARIESGKQQPSLPLLARILAAVDLEMRIGLAPYDDHDDGLDAQDARLTSAELGARHKTQDEFVARFHAASR